MPRLKEQLLCALLANREGLYTGQLLDMLKVSRKKLYRAIAALRARSDVLILSDADLEGHRRRWVAVCLRPMQLALEVHYVRARG